MSLRIIGGKFQRRKLQTAQSINLRPTKSILRETVFNICQNYIEDAYFLDIFSGTGAMGIEAISRGALYAVFIEKDSKSACLIQQNISLLKIEDQAEVICKDVFKGLKTLDNQFDIIYIDPPYELFEKHEEKMFFIFQELADKKLVKANAILFLEGPYNKSREKSPYEFPFFKNISKRKIGKTILYQYQLN